jgi:hypothetical protein
VFNLFYQNVKKYEYGYRDRNPSVYRRCVKTGEVQFILWKKGEHGHKDDYWHRIDPFWWGEFKPYKE